MYVSWLFLKTGNWVEILFIPVQHGAARKKEGEFYSDCRDCAIPDLACLDVKLPIPSGTAAVPYRYMKVHTLSTGSPQAGLQPVYGFVARKLSDNFVYSVVIH
jgi:hypothetical protein